MRNNNPLVCDKLLMLLQHTREGKSLRDIVYRENVETVELYLEGKQEPYKSINVAGDSELALIKDVINRL